jgi:hypothetical protein
MQRFVGSLSLVFRCHSKGRLSMRKQNDWLVLWFERARANSQAAREHSRPPAISQRREHTAHSIGKALTGPAGGSNSPVILDNECWFPSVDLKMAVAPSPPHSCSNVPEHSLTFVKALVELCEILHEERFYLIGFGLLVHAHEERSHE